MALKSLNMVYFRECSPKNDQHDLGNLSIAAAMLWRDRDETDAMPQTHTRSPCEIANMTKTAA